jgi:hypothetical protein
MNYDVKPMEKRLVSPFVAGFISPPKNAKISVRKRKL